MFNVKEGGVIIGGVEDMGGAPFIGLHPPGGRGIVLRACEMIERKIASQRVRARIRCCELRVPIERCHTNEPFVVRFWVHGIIQLKFPF